MEIVWYLVLDAWDFTMMEMLYNIWKIATKPDNIPIAGMLVLSIFFGWLGLSTALKNDRIRRKYPQTDKKNDPHLVDVVDIVYPESEQRLQKKVLTWPYLVKIEFICAIILMALLFFWSVRIDAPLEEPANPGLSPNPAKAPWYFLGLQDMLVYFDPWIAGVVVPGLIILGLMVIPYVDVNPKGAGYYTFAERKFAILTFFFGYFILWVFFIIIGTFLRGPGWMWFWPWEAWNPHRVVSETNVNLNEFIAMNLGISALKSEQAGFILGAVAVLGYYFLGITVPYLILKWRQSPTLIKIGFVRYSIVTFLFWSMMGMTIKVLLRLVFHIKYVWVTPWFNI